MAGNRGGGRGNGKVPKAAGKEREENIEPRDLGIETAVPSEDPASKRAPKRARPAATVEPTRRSVRTQALTPVDYTQEKTETLGSEDFGEAGWSHGREQHLKALASGRKLKNSGAGPPPLGADAPFGGRRYTPLTKGLDEPDLPSKEASEGSRNKKGQLLFNGEPNFLPTLTPGQMVRRGIFGGCYFNPRGGKKGIFGRDVAVDHEEFPADWFEDVPENMYNNRRYDIKLNKYKVKAGQDQAFWESKGWIHKQDPRGWFQWYCRFYLGRRTQDDDRQISRWKGVVGEKGRWKNALCNKVVAQNRQFDDPAVSPVIRQTLLHWGYELTEADFLAFRKRVHKY